MIKLKIIIIVFILSLSYFIIACAPSTTNKFNVTFYNSQDGFVVLVSERDVCNFIFCNAKDDEFATIVDDFMSTLNTDNPIDVAVCSFTDDNYKFIAQISSSYVLDNLFIPTPISYYDHDKYVTLKSYSIANDINCEVVSSISLISDDDLVVRIFNHVSSGSVGDSSLSFTISFDNHHFGFLFGNMKNQQATATLMNIALSKKGTTLQSAVNLDFLSFPSQSAINENVLHLLNAKNLYVSNCSENFLESVYDYLPNTTVFTDKTYEKLSLSVSDNNTLLVSAD